MSKRHHYDANGTYTGYSTEVAPSSSYGGESDPLGAALAIPFIYGVLFPFWCLFVRLVLAIPHHLWVNLNSTPQIPRPDIGFDISWDRTRVVGYIIGLAIGGFFAIATTWKERGKSWTAAAALLTALGVLSTVGWGYFFLFR